MPLCDLILVFLLSRGNGVTEEVTLWVPHEYAEAELDKERNGTLIDVIAVEQFDCNKQPENVVNHFDVTAPHLRK